MRIKRKNALNFSVGAFWVFAGFVTINISIFVISIPLEDRALWFQVLEAIDKSSYMLLVAFISLAFGILQMFWGFFMMYTRDSTLDKVEKGIRDSKK